jgi:surface protein
LYNPEIDLEEFASFSESLNCWDTSSVEDIQGMFAYSQTFNNAISAWDVSNVRDMKYMFAHSSFNQDIGSWKDV